MAGAEFVRADLHVHTLPDNPSAHEHSVDEFIEAAVAQGIRILGITDHNRVDRVRAAIKAAANVDLLVLPGIEVTTHEGHLLALFDPEHVEALEEFATQGVLHLIRDPRDQATRSQRGMLDLVSEIGRRGGLAIAAHIDTQDGLLAGTTSQALASLLASQDLAALEFTRAESLRDWITATDDDGGRHGAWMARQAVPELKERGLARIMSSDAHSPEKVGQDRNSRTLTRLRIDDLNFTAVRNALMYAPKARCKAEVNLPPAYPRILRAEFEGGFLDGVAMDFSQNLNCLIGGRGSGKSTALLAIRTALGETVDPMSGEDPDDPYRMPTTTRVTFVDAFGTERSALRRRGSDPVDATSNAPISLPLQGFGQDEPGRLARGYDTTPARIVEFLEQFVNLGTYDTRENELLAALADNAAEVKRTNTGLSKLPGLEKKLREQEARLAAAQTSRLESIAQWAALLASEGPLLESVRSAVAAFVSDRPKETIDLDKLARRVGVDPNSARATQFLGGEDGLRARVAALQAQRDVAGKAWAEVVADAADSVRQALTAWEEDHKALKKQLDTKQKELAAQGLKVQVGQVKAVADEIEALRKEIDLLKQRQAEHNLARAHRRGLLTDLRANRDARFQRRRAALKKVVDASNAAADGLTIHVRHERTGIREPWEDWLGRSFKFRSPRVERVARAVSPAEMAEFVLTGGKGLDAVEWRGERLFTSALISECVPALQTWDTVFELETMRLEDLLRIEVREAGATTNRTFDRLSAGQQRSILLSLVLCAEGSDPLVVDQPEDHLDAQYIASALVGHLEAAKERRQVILATHSPNLTVLGDAELVIPMYADAGHGEPRDPGAVDRPTTRTHVCALLEGGLDAFRRRGQRYGLRFQGSLEKSV